MDFKRIFRGPLIWIIVVAALVIVDQPKIIVGERRDGDDF